MDQTKKDIHSWAFKHHPDFCLEAKGVKISFSGRPDAKRLLGNYYFCPPGIIIQAKNPEENPEELTWQEIDLSFYAGILTSKAEEILTDLRKIQEERLTAQRALKRPKGGKTPPA